MGRGLLVIIHELIAAVGLGGVRVRGIRRARKGRAGCWKGGRG